MNTYTYDAYGARTSSSETVGNPFGYAGEYRDNESGFAYLRARYYDPTPDSALKGIGNCGKECYNSLPSALRNIPATR